MKSVASKARVAVVIALGLLGGALSLWLVRGDGSRQFRALQRSALCEVALPAGRPSAVAEFANPGPVERFEVAVRTKARGEGLSVSISGQLGVVGSVSAIRSSRFGLGQGVKPGVYTVTLSQEAGGHGGTVLIAAAAPDYLSGWQIWSRAYVGLLAGSGVFTFLLRRSANPRARAASKAAFHSLLLGFVVLFVYLLCHEGGHALAQLAFGHFDLARSDFWGIHGHPHSGGTMGPPLRPWQHLTISCAGPLLPSLVGFGLFGLWLLPWARALRRRWPTVGLYLSAVVAMLVFPEVICGPAYQLGLIGAEGDPLRYAAQAGGPAWLVRGLLGGLALACAAVLWQVGPELWRTWKTLCLSPGAAPSCAPPGGTSVTGR